MQLLIRLSLFVVSIFSATSVSPPRTDMVFKLQRISEDSPDLGIPALWFHDSSEQHGFVRLLFRRLSGLHGSNERSDEIHLVDVNGQLIPFEANRNSDESESSFGLVDITPRGSLLASAYSGFFITQPPRSPNRPDEQITFILSPTNVITQYCRDGFMGFTGIIGDNFLQFRSQTALIDASVGGNEEYRIIAASDDAVLTNVVPTETMRIPFGQYTMLQEVLVQRTGLRWSEFELHPECELMIDRLPTIRHTIVDSYGTGVVEVHVLPSDYVLVHGDGPRRCEIVVDSRGGYDWIGLPFMRSAGIFVDYTRQRIGFCEPL